MMWRAHAGPRARPAHARAYVSQDKAEVIASRVMVEGTNLPLKMPVSRFDELESELPGAVLENLKRGPAPTALQQYVLPVHLAGRDLAVLGASARDQSACLIASTIASVLAAPPSAPKGATEPCRPRALVLVPTRDHAQIAAAEARALTEGTALRYALAYGGHTMERSLEEVGEDAGLLIATPTRLFDLTERGVLKLDAVRILVLVAADTLLDFGFTPQVGAHSTQRKLPPPTQDLLGWCTAPHLPSPPHRSLAPSPSRHCRPPQLQQLIEEESLPPSSGDRHSSSTHRPHADIYDSSTPHHVARRPAPHHAATASN